MITIRNILEKRTHKQNKNICEKAELEKNFNLFIQFIFHISSRLSDLFGGPKPPASSNNSLKYVATKDPKKVKAGKLLF